MRKEKNPLWKKLNSRSYKNHDLFIYLFFLILFALLIFIFVVLDLFAKSELKNKAYGMMNFS